MDKQTSILKAALNLFVEFGFHGTPTSKIASEAGVSNGTLFHYYKTKDELVAALYIFEKDKLNAAMDTEVSQFTSVKEKFHALFRSSVQWALENQEAYFFIQQVHFSPHLNLIDDKIKEKQARLHTDLLGSAIEQDLFKPLDRELIGQLFGNHVNGVYFFLAQKKLSKAKQTEAIKTSSDLIWTMLKK